MDSVKSQMRVRVKTTGQTGVVYGPVAGSGASFISLEARDAITKPIATEWEKWHVSLNAGGMAAFHQHELEEIDEDEELVRTRHERAEAEWQEFLRKTYGNQ